MKKFFKKVWDWIKKSAKFIWYKLLAFISKYNWKLKLFSKGIKGDDDKKDTTFMCYPSIFVRSVNKAIEIGIIWFNVGVKLIVSKK